VDIKGVGTSDLASGGALGMWISGHLTDRSHNRSVTWPTGQVTGHGYVTSKFGKIRKISPCPSTF
jgi:hypothetical protein